jgi:hypothetical protein
MGNARTHLGCKCVLGITQEFCEKLGMGVIAGYVINVGKILSFYLSLSKTNSHFVWSYGHGDHVIRARQGRRVA